MTRKSLGYVSVLLIAISAAVFYGCGQSSSSPSTPHGTTAYVGTQSPGDVWHWTLGEGTMSATNETTGKHYAGTFSTLSSGFLKGRITSTDDTAISTGATLYMLEYPKTMLLVKPVGSTAPLIACAARLVGTPEVGRYNFVKFPYPGWTTNNKAYGTVEVTKNGSLYDFFITTYKIDGTPKETETETGYGASDGRFIRTGSSLEVFMTPSGIFFGDSAGSAGFAGVKNETISVSDLIAQNYRGVLYDYNSSTGLGDIVAIGAGPHPTVVNSLQGWDYANVDNNVKGTGLVTLTFGTQDSSGVVSGTLSGGTNPKLFKLVAAKIDGKYVVIGIDAADAHSPENFVLVQQ